MTQYFSGDRVRIAVGPLRGRVGKVGMVLEDADHPLPIDYEDDTGYDRLWYDDDELELIERANAWDS